MDIGIVTELFSPHQGGQERRYLELSQCLHKRGHNVHVFTIRYKKELQEEEYLDGIHIHRYAYTPNYLQPEERSISGVMRFGFETLKRISSYHFDLCLFNEWPLLHILFVEPFCKFFTVIDWCDVWLNGIIGVTQRLVSRFPDSHITVSEFEKYKLVSNFKISEHNIEVIPSGINTSIYLPNLTMKEKGRVLYIGRLVPHKRVDMLIEAVKIAHRVRPEITLDIIGEGPLFHLIKEHITGSEDFIRLHGLLAEQDKIDFLKRAWTIALASEREGFPRVFAEAMAAGTPIITTNHPGNTGSYIVNKYKSGITTPHQPKAIADSLLRILQDEYCWRLLASNCLAGARELDWEIIVKRFESFIYKKLSEFERR